MRRAVPLALLVFVACSVSIYVRQESDTLYFGTAKQHGGVVSETEWSQFLSEVVTPRFPGFTQWMAQGQWMNQREDTHVLVIVHPPGREAAIRQIINEGEKRLDQKEVLQVRTDVWLPTH